MSHKIVDVVHDCGYTEQAHSVELGEHSKSSHEAQVVDHLRVKPCPKCKNRGSWSWFDHVEEAEPIVAPEPLLADA